MDHSKQCMNTHPEDDAKTKHESCECSENPDEKDVQSGVGFSILENGTICGRRKLIDTRGYTYNVRRVKDSRTYWWCSVRNKTIYCKASVIQLGEVFRLGSKEHCHEPKPELKVKRKRKSSQKSETLRAEDNKCSSLGGQIEGPVSQTLYRVALHKKKDIKVELKVKKPLEVKYRIIDEGTRCGKRKLVDSQGYEYNIKCVKNSVTYWWCAVRNKTVHCRATVSQRGNKFKIGKIEHCHKAAFRPKMKLTAAERMKPEATEIEKIAYDNASSSSIINEDTKYDFEIPGESLTFHVLTKISKSKGVLLVDSEGFTYKLKRQKEDQAYWICVEQSKSHRCSATVSQRGNKFRLGKVEHCHMPSSLPELRDAFVGTHKCGAISVTDVVAKCLNLEMLEGSFLNEHDRVDSNEEEEECQAVTGRNQRDIIAGYIPKHFLQRDIRLDSEQHLILAFKEQIDLLSQAQVWFLDTDVRLVPEPFAQLFTITTCIESAEEIQYVPLVFILMSRCQREDYLKVFQIIREVLPHPLITSKVVTSVDEALWDAIAEVFPECRIQGCAFQWAKALWKKVMELGLEPDCCDEDGESGLINSLLAIPFLPPNHIGFAFRGMRDKARGLEKFEELLDYIDATWISNSTWDLSSWSTFMHPVRTRADVESWHIEMPLENDKPSFYKLMWLLLQEAKLVPLHVQVINDENLSKNQRNKEGEIQKEIFYLWDMYSAGNLSTNAFLREIGMVCSHVLK